MKIEVFISGNNYLRNNNNFGDTLKTVLEQSYDSKYHKELHQNKANNVQVLSAIMQKKDIEEVISNHLTLDRNFAEKLQLFDVVHCFCLKPKTAVGEVVIELMIDNYQLILTSRNWIEPEHLRLSFEAVDYGESTYFLNDTILKRKKLKTTSRVKITGNQAVSLRSFALFRSAVPVGRASLRSTDTAQLQ